MARCIETIVAEVAALAYQGPVEIMQHDTVFDCRRGRLKLREFSVDAGELIFYRRPDQTGPKESRFIVAPTASPGRLREALLTRSAARPGKRSNRFSANRLTIL
jgi:adenylate cyclase